jgi:hypothetical protein
MGKVLSSGKLLVQRFVAHIISLHSLIYVPFSVLDQCKTLAMAAERLIELWQAPSFSQSGTNAPHTRLSKQFAEPILLGPDRPIEGVGDQLFRLLPPLPEAIHLCEVYRAYGKYM